mmetsp:Transcript_68348/g.198064  ORF Transcript_68348/g.198064 Transcript_68348/m.198064 type:complete len:225 (-) Transcript_68348:131-805(-)
MWISTNKPPDACNLMGPCKSECSATIVPGGSSRRARAHTPASRRERAASLGGDRNAFEGTGSTSLDAGQMAWPRLTSSRVTIASESSGINSASMPPKALERRMFTGTSESSSQRWAAMPGKAGTLTPPPLEPGRPKRMTDQATFGSTSSAPSRSANFDALGSKLFGTQATAESGSCTTAQKWPPNAAARTHSGTPRCRMSCATGSGSTSRQTVPTGGGVSGSFS